MNITTRPVVRFAPAPTGMMHLGNVRTALMNYLFAQKNQGIFVLRIEDTDAQRNYDPHAEYILEDLAWLGISYDEGPKKEGNRGPYFQSQRIALYAEKLATLIEKKAVYRCFCSAELLEKKRKRQLALKQPPHYDRACMTLSDADNKKLLEAHTPFIWRFILDTSKTVSFLDMAHGNMSFELKFFSDVPLTRQDGSFTFIFANAVDDITMGISHIFRGEDHLTNTATQIALFDAFGVPHATYWHMPILCNIEGKKLSKRDFGFSLRDLKASGYLPEAIGNYLAIIGSSFIQEIMDYQELIKTYNFGHLSTTGHIKYDTEKLRWMNHKWMERLSLDDFVERCRPLIYAAYERSTSCPEPIFRTLLQHTKPEIKTLQECVTALQFYWEYIPPTPESFESIEQQYRTPLITSITQHLLTLENDPDMFVESVKKDAKKNTVPLQQLFTTLRLMIMGHPHGPGIKELIQLLGIPESKKRLELGLQTLGTME
ncbi:MAG TPA: glutamate--tRNA ligase [Candidatus Bathyarchaeia archaeon]|nr:glutamate--tRNA ligase [Candidatus Bathyarchaeia archaeon]